MDSSQLARITNFIWGIADGVPEEVVEADEGAEDADLASTSEESEA